MTSYQHFAKRLFELLGNSQAVRITVPGFLPLTVEEIEASAEGRRQISLVHYGEQNGDLMRDPEMVFDIIPHPAATPGGARLMTREAWRNTPADYRGQIDGEPAVLELDPSGATVLAPVCLTEPSAEPVYFRNDYAGLEQWVYVCDEDGGRIAVRPRLKRELKSFARVWFRNLRAQGFLRRDAAREVLS
jgi:hypothetical protein